MESIAPVTALPDVTSALTWRDWETGRAEARQRRVPVLALAEAPWATSAQRLGLILSQDEVLRDDIERHVVPVIIDPCARPDLVSRWRTASVALTGSCGPPLVMLLTHEGQPLLSYCTMWPEGREPYPSLGALVRATGDAYARDLDPLLADARTLASGAGGAPPAWRAPREWLQDLIPQFDPAYGGVSEIPRHPHPQLLWFLLDLHESGSAPEAGGFIKTALGAMLRGGIYDQIDAGFHRCSRDSRWIAPHFEKPVPLNAQLAAVYARAARAFDHEEWRVAASSLITFCLGMVQQDIDVVSADTGYYTWTAQEFLGALDPALVQAISLHFNMVPGSARQVLYRARNLQAIQQYSDEAPAMLQQRLRDGQEQLRAARATRAQPPGIALSTLSWPAETIRWLCQAAHYGSEVPLPEVTGHLAALIGKGLDREVGFVRFDRDGAPHAWLEDQASLLGASLAAYHATADDHWLTQARDLAEMIRFRYRRNGGWRDTPLGVGDDEASVAIIDDVVPSTIATLTEGFAELSHALNDPAYARIARDSASAALMSAAATCPHQSAGYWRAWFQIDVPANDFHTNAAPPYGRVPGTVAALQEDCAR